MFSLKYVITTITSITMITKMKNTTFGPTTSLIYDVEICKEPEPREVEDRWTQQNLKYSITTIVAAIALLINGQKLEKLESC